MANRGVAVAQWTSEVTATRAAAQAQLRDATGARTARMIADEIEALVTSLGSLLTMLRDADTADRWRSTAASDFGSPTSQANTK